MQDKPYAIFGTCLGAIVGYEIAQRAKSAGLPTPLAFFPAAVSPPHLYAQAVMKLYIAPGESVNETSFETVIKQLKGWEDLPRELVMMVYLNTRSHLRIVSRSARQSSCLSVTKEENIIACPEHIGRNFCKHHARSLSVLSISLN